MSSYPLSPPKEEALLKKMAELGIREADITENFILGSGSGGQKINKTASCVQLIHPPSGIEIRCQKTRSQSLNRFFARRLLVEEIEKRVLGRKSEVRQKIEKIRRQKRKRSKRAKDKMLDNKKHQGEKKKNRQVKLNDY